MSETNNKTKSRAEYQKLRRLKLKEQTFKLSKKREDALNKIPDDITEPDTTINNDDDDDDVNFDDAAEQYQQEYDKIVSNGSKSLLMPDEINEFTEYFETNHIVQELEDTRTELKQTQVLLNKTNELVKILNDELINKHNENKDLKKQVPPKKIITVNDLNKYFHLNKYKMLDNSELDEVELSKEHHDILKQKLIDFEDEFIMDIKQKYSLVDKI